MTVNMGATQVL